MEIGKYRIDPNHAEYAGTQDNDNRRHNAFTKPARGGNGAVHKRGKGVRAAHHSQANHACLHHGGVRGKQGEEFLSKQHQSASQQSTRAEGEAQADKIAAQHALFVARAHVLRHKAGTGSIQRSHHIINQRVSVGRGSRAFYNHRVKGINTRLNEQIGNGKDGILRTGR